MARVVLAICRAISWLQLALLLTMLGVMASLVFTRYIFSYSPPWSEELTRFSMVWMVMLGGGVLALFDDHITLFVFVEKLHPWVKVLRVGVVRTILIATAAVVMVKGVKFAAGMGVVIAWGLQITMLVPAYSVAVGFGLILAANVILLIGEIASLFGIETNMIPRQAEVMDGSFRPQDEL